MTHRARKAHYVRRNETTRIPTRHIIFDTETHRDTHARGEVQTWRLACATFLQPSDRRHAPETSGRYIDPGELWEAVSAHAKPRKRTILWAHNLAFDVRIARVFDYLPALGWQLVDVNLATHGAWLKWRRDDASLVMVDSTSVWPASLEAIGRDLGMDKPDLPAEDADEASWWARCEADVAILTAAVKDHLAWIRDDDLGNWQITGAGQSWATWRHRFYDCRVLVHDNTEALAAERRAMWTGRAEAWRIGRAATPRVYEYDLAQAYTRIAADAQLPVRLVSAMGPMTIERYRTLSRRYAIVADVIVTTETECVPCHYDGAVVWPVGTFPTTLWDVEIDLALAEGATVEIARAWTYLRSPALADWARWILAELDPATTTLSPLRRRVIKHWSRALIGRFAMRYRRWETFGTAPTDDLGLIPGVDLRDGEPYQLMRAGRQILAQSGMEEGESSVPAITGWIMAAARVRLWEVMQAVGLGRVLYVDTDSVLVAEADQIAAEAAAAANPAWALRLKRSWASVDVRGPRCLILGGEPRISGLPRAAVRTGPSTFVGETWQSLETAIKAGTADRVVVSARSWTPTGRDRRRAHLAEGLTGPRRYDVGGCDHPDADLVDPLASVGPVPV